MVVSSYNYASNVEKQLSEVEKYPFSTFKLWSKLQKVRALCPFLVVVQRPHYYVPNKDDFEFTVLFMKFDFLFLVNVWTLTAWKLEKE